ncbi:phosphoenolpyruvate synthase [Allokutzneria sp. A3M-2-11 16]|uniref:PEP/pyruvate-binding domain-containing protein n=1 Tax=Allokutzneria sp. A3M-2-11 16 TaxID=2962043 RepID=UPI0020B8A866|nr:PEP/pyruvate-binding domain-containing protein [Allokutzneria sp. A3M-2-11 16]MCP3801888.1 phosphoenolpyruvate synthase [Allokutzneria sp. A3M-2-11 16]
MVGERLTLAAFDQLSGTLSGYRFVKLVVDRERGTIHFINHAEQRFHAEYIATHILDISTEEMYAKIDSFNQIFYHEPDRRFCLGLLSLHDRDGDRFLALETVEVDTMPAEMIKYFYGFVRDNVDAALPLVFKPASHLQERHLLDIPAVEVPRIQAHELFASTRFVPLNAGTTKGRLRAFRTQAEYRAAAESLEWFDIIAMDRVPDDIPRLAGVINSEPTTPLSHTNVLASGWGIPNAVQLGAIELIDERGLDGEWVEYGVDAGSTEIALKRAEKPADLPEPAWRSAQITLEEPETDATPIVALDQLRMRDAHRYGTKAANLGELGHVLAYGSERLLGFHRVPRPPRANLLMYAAKQLGVPESADLNQAAWQLLTDRVSIPRGIAVPFSVQRRFLESSPRVQQAIGKLKMALELGAREIDPLCIELQRLVRSTRMPEDLRQEIDRAIFASLGGVQRFVIRSSSNAEDLAGFSAAGIYESVNQVATADEVFTSVKRVWASLFSSRSVRLRQQAGISQDDSYMGVIVQEEVQAPMGGVLVTCNPMSRADFRNVYLNVSRQSVAEVVSGDSAPLQYLYNTVEGGGRTVSLGDAGEDLDEQSRNLLQHLALAGRFLQSHFSPDYTFGTPMDIEWVADSERVHIVQLRPYSN